MKIVFILGLDQSTGTPIQESIKLEAKHYGDVLIGNYIDAYRNNTLKVWFSFLRIYDLNNKRLHGCLWPRLYKNSLITACVF